MTLSFFFLAAIYTKTTFSVEPMELPRLQWDDSRVASYISHGRPIVLLNCPLATPAANRWSPDYLSITIEKKFPCFVFASDSLRFPYWDEKKNNGYNFVNPTEKIDNMTFQKFLKLMRNNGSVNSTENSSKNSSESLPTKKYYYLQQSVVAEMGQAMMDEYLKFSLNAAVQFKLAGRWDAFSTNLLLVGPAGAVTPCHFDEQENLFGQIYGRKRVRLFPPEAWKRLYPYPLNHACDRQTRVCLPNNPGSIRLDVDNDLFPAFEKYANDPELGEYVVDLSAGEILYVPQFWFHQMEALTENVSLSWWFKHQTKQFMKADGALDLSVVSYVSVRRNLEKIISQMLGGGRNAHSFFLALAAGKVPIPREFEPAVFPNTPPPANSSITNSTIESYNATDQNDHDKHDDSSGKKSETCGNHNSVVANGSTTSSSTSSSAPMSMLSSSSSSSSSINYPPSTNTLLQAHRDTSLPTTTITSHQSPLSSCTTAVSTSSRETTQPADDGEHHYSPDYDSFEEFLPRDVQEFESQNIPISTLVPAAALVTQALQISSCVLGTQNAPAFLKELVSGRFSGL